MNERVEVVGAQRLTAIRDGLAALRVRDRERAAFGAALPYGHDYREQPRLDDREIDALTSALGVALPRELEAFLRHVHAGGSGPGYGFFVVAPRAASGRDARPFPYDQDAAAASIRTLQGSDRNDGWLELVEDPEDGEDWPPGPGFIPIAHHGCGVFDVLVLSGEERGHVWTCDMKWAPVHDRGGPLGFLAWYERWLHGALAARGLRPWGP